MLNSARCYLKLADKLLDKYNNKFVFFGIFLCALILFTRRPEAFLHPQFWAEDGKTWYADAYNLGFKSIIMTYASYLTITYRTVGILSQLLPLKLAPLFFNIVALSFQLMPVFILLSGRLTKQIPSKVFTLLICILLVAIPNSTEVFLNLTNIQWHLGMASFLVLLSNETKNIYWRIFDLTVLIATGLAGPLLIMLAPVGALIWYFGRKKYQLINLVLILVLCFSQLLNIFILSDYHRTGSQANASIYYLIKMISGQIFTGGLLGEKYVDIFYGNSTLLYIVLISGISILIYSAIKGPAWIKYFYIFAFSIIFSMLASLKPVPGFNAWQGLTNPTGGQRYWYIPILAWLTTIIWISVKAPHKYMRGLGYVLALILLFGITSDWKLRSYKNENFQSHVKEFSRLEKNEVYSMPINPNWNMDLKKH